MNGNDTSPNHSVSRRSFTSLHSAISGNLEVLEQARGLVRSLTQEQYVAVPAMVRHGIGRHIRHILDLYLALLSGVHTGIVDYDIRHRDNLVETDRQTGLVAIGDILSQLRTCEITIDSHLFVKSEASVEKTETVTVLSTPERELLYLANHTVHHLAYVALMARMLGVFADDAIGLAPATASYLRETSTGVSTPAAN